MQRPVKKGETLDDMIGRKLRAGLVDQETQEERRLRRERELNDIKAVLSTREGRRFIWRLLTIGSLFRTTFTGNSTTFFLEGHRNLALLILNDIQKVDFHNFGTLWAEAVAEGLLKDEEEET